jgi:23S rRNA U2552 (ribose-2'-O)-methylase RlmE/FtsJ
MRLRKWEQDSRLDIKFLDITMLASAMGVSTIPPDHPESEKFLLDPPPFAGQEFDLVFCDGQVLRSQQLEEYRKESEAGRLTTSQLVLAVTRVREGGSIVMLLHKVEVLRTAHLLHTFSKFASVALFKPRHSHATRSSFYMVATNVRPHHAPAQAAVQQWKQFWAAKTFPAGKESLETPSSTPTTGPETAMSLIGEFGPELAQLGRPVWKVQADALRKAPFIRSYISQKQRRVV